MLVGAELMFDRLDIFVLCFFVACLFEREEKGREIDEVRGP